MPTKPMSKEDAARIQSAAARSGTNEEFARRAQSAADKRETKPSGDKKDQ